MPSRWFLVSIAVGCGLAAALWVRSALFRSRYLRLVERDHGDVDTAALASSGLARDVTLAALFGSVAVAAAVVAITDDATAWYVLGLVFVPVATSIWMARYARRDARLSYARYDLEQRARAVLTQETSAPQRWAERLAPRALPEPEAYLLGTSHQAGSGLMSGDLLDVCELPGGRLAAVVGDVAGQGVEASITALQVKYLLRSYLRRYRDPGQALEELNAQLIDLERPEEFVSLFVAILDPVAGTVRHASAGHPVGWLCSDRLPQALRATGPLLMLDPSSTFLSAERPFLTDDVLLVSTDGLTEARNGDQFFGEERVAAVLRRDPDAAPEVLCKSLIDAAVDFVGGPLVDDVTILAVRCR